MPMNNPAHPGRIIRSDLDAMGLSVEEAALTLKVTPGQLSQVINGEAGVTPEMAAGLGKLLGGDGNILLRIQAAYDAARQPDKDLAPAENLD